jgi:hypothetical protein
LLNILLEVAAESRPGILVTAQPYTSDALILYTCFMDLDPHNRFIKHFSFHRQSMAITRVIVSTTEVFIYDASFDQRYHSHLPARKLSW